MVLNEKFKVIVQVLMFVSILTIGNLLWKLGLVKMGGFMTDNRDIVLNFVKLVSSVYIWAGCILYILGTLLWFYIMSKEDLSYIYPLVSIGYVATMILGVVIFKENVPVHRWLGAAIMILGFSIMAQK